MNVLAKILQAGQLVAVLVGIGVELALKIKALLELDPDITVNIESLTGQAIAADERTMKKVNAFRAKLGLPPLEE